MSRGGAAAAGVLGVFLAVAACGGDDDGDGGGADAGAGEIDAGGDGAVLHTYVVDSVNVPTNAEESDDLAFDQDDDATADNQLGNFLDALTQAAGATALDLQGHTDIACDTGALLLLIGLETSGLETATGAHLATYRGEDPDPAACEGEDDLVCRHHFEGDASIGVVAGTPELDGCAGDIADGTFNGGPPGEIIVQLAIGVGVVDLPLTRARALVGEVEESRLGGAVLAGVVPEDVLDAEVVPDIQGAVQATIDADCEPAGEDCNCLEDSIGLTFLSLFDGDVDCAVSLAELRESALVSTLLVADVDTDEDGEPDGFSAGVGVTAVSATFDPP